MLKGISPLLSPDLLKMLCEMGHGDEILLADAHFPGHTLGKHVLRADGLTIPQLLDAILPLLVLDEHANPLIMMQPDAGDSADPTVEADFLSAARRLAPEVSAIIRIPRPAFYDRAKSAYAVVITGELRAYGNLILRKGVTPIVK
ncbi:L-fucose mutarotase [Alloacidobacterium sp.]|uniref:L-fucose mutarotase n=1 Tax=Alloacidobacterium sp. TaxID=2951999 RepID=UPI002D69C4BF|nr:L-fucose mutarotase [Alloacidobacterium sp.]HYK35059.1 L-fucose mutarotase [Alloacidobacterium sp.]